MGSSPTFSLHLPITPFAAIGIHELPVAARILIVWVIVLLISLGHSPGQIEQILVILGLVAAIPLSGPAV